jgi:hypothetical protein
VEAVLLGAGLAAILVGLVALVEAVRPWCGGRGKNRPTSPSTCATARVEREPFMGFLPRWNNN